VFDLKLSDFTGESPLIGIRPAQGHVTHAESVKIAKQMDVILDGMPPSIPSARPAFSADVPSDIGDAEGHHHAVADGGGLNDTEIDQSSVRRRSSPTWFRLDPDGKNSAPRLPARACPGSCADVFRILLPMRSLHRESAAACGWVSMTIAIREWAARGLTVWAETERGTEAEEAG